MKEWFIKYFFEILASAGVAILAAITPMFAVKYEVKDCKKGMEQLRKHLTSTDKTVEELSKKLDEKTSDIDDKFSKEIKELTKSVYRGQMAMQATILTAITEIKKK